MRKLTIAGVSLLLAACASNSTTPAPRPATVPVAVAPPVAMLHGDVAQFNEALVLVHDFIVEREAESAAGIIDDYEAATSIEIPDHPSIFGALNLFSTDLKPRIQASLDRSTRYRAMIDAILDEHELPRALAYLPVIESGYITSNVSRVGAYGMWQFMPATAREYGLRVDWWVDERADPERSTRAAARYLKDLHAKFEDWPLALASYNAGPGRVRRSLAANAAENFWDLSSKAALPRETRGYVPTFFATLMIVSQPEAHGFLLCEPVKELDDAVEVAISGPVSLKFIAETAGIEERLLRELNPMLRRGVTPPGTIRVRLPKFASSRVADSAGSLRGDDPYLQVARYTVRKGDNLKSLARKLGAESRTISAMNGGVGKLRTGAAIWVPVSQTELSRSLAQKPKSKYHTVKKGETLFAIAKRHGLSVDELRSLNNIPRKSVLKTGQKLRVSVTHAVTAGGL
ncbi:MAG: transglycosylase SLT domain-containing protein [Acidobacteria bacterium]|nr:transglycosylase SLT domain-containing protein [Acidobacteriota bacterium]